MSYCDNCGYKTKVEKHHEGNPAQTYELCRVCASTHLSKAVTYPEQCPDPNLYKSIGWVVNLVLDELNQKVSG